MKIGRSIRHLFHPVVGEIWCMHRVLPERSGFKSNRELEITPEYLERAIVDYLADGYRFVSTDEFVAASADRRLCHAKRLVNVTFDDGYVDVFEYAYPILLKHQIPFTIYLTTDMPDGKADLWWVQLENMANGDVAWFEVMLRQIYESGENMPDVMHRLTQTQPDLDLNKNLALTWEQLAQMQVEGLCTIGSHTVTHPGLDRISEEQVAYELGASKRRIEEVLKMQVCHFSFPHSFYNDVVTQAVWEAGYRSAVIGYGGKTRWERGRRLFYRRNMVQV